MLLNGIRFYFLRIKPYRKLDGREDRVYLSHPVSTTPVPHSTYHPPHLSHPPPPHLSTQHPPPSSCYKVVLTGSRWIYGTTNTTTYLPIYRTPVITSYLLQPQTRD